jgi:hypothetical protein
VKDRRDRLDPDARGFPDPRLSCGTVIPPTTGEMLVSVGRFMLQAGRLIAAVIFGVLALGLLAPVVLWLVWGLEDNPAVSGCGPMPCAGFPAPWRARGSHRSRPNRDTVGA